MNCSKFESIVSELARAQIMKADLRKEALIHTSECEVCLRRLQEESSLSRGLEILRVAAASETASAAIETRLMEAFRSREVVYPIVPARSNGRYWLAAVAATLLIVFSVVAVRLRSERVGVAPQIAKSNKSAPTNIESKSDTASPFKPAIAKNESPAVRKSKANLPARAGKSTRIQNPNVAVANHVVNEVATDFVPLGYLNVANLQDGAQILRVELPRSALANFGFPVNMDRYNERVKADVLLGADGMAHAIRFVQ